MLRTVQRLQWLTIVWMAVEAFIALDSAWVAHSPALLGFGGDSAIELLSATIILWRFRSDSRRALSEKLAARVAGALLFAVAAFVLATSVLALLGYREPKRSRAGIALLIAAALVMPWLTRQKRKLAVQMQSAALRADAAESALCGSLALIALTGLLVNAVFDVPWADPVAALLIIPFVVKEAYEAIAHPSRPCCSN